MITRMKEARRTPHCRHKRLGGALVPACQCHHPSQSSAQSMARGGVLLCVVVVCVVGGGYCEALSRLIHDPRIVAAASGT